ncbi:hypothetical protein PRIC1_013594 [Phytophthora ramorum]
MFAMTVEEAAVEAAATNDIEWLERLLARIDIDDDRDEIGCKATDIAAAPGYNDVIKTIDRWWVGAGYEPTFLCQRALFNAVAGGHQETVRVLLSDWYVMELYEAHFIGDDPEQTYDFDMVEALELAVNNKDDKIIWVLCELNDCPGKIFKWAAEHDDFQVFHGVFHFHYLDDMDNLYAALLIAASRGCMDIVKLVIDRCGAEMLDFADDYATLACPLVTAIESGRREMIDFLYAHDCGHKDESFGSAFCAAAASGPMEVLKLFYDKEHFDASTLEGAFASAARTSQLEIMKFLQSKQDFSSSAINKAFVAAACFGQTEAAKYLCSIEGHETSPSSLDKAFEGAASGCHINMLQYVDGKGNFSRKVVSKAFERAITDVGLLSETRNDQARVLKFLHSKGSVYPEVISEFFPEAARSCDVDVVKLVYSMGSISSESVQSAFQNAAKGNCVEVVEFLCTTGSVPQKAGEDMFLDAVDRHDLYTMECLFSCGCTTQVILEAALQKHFSSSTLPHRVLLFLKQKQQTRRD